MGKIKAVILVAALFVSALSSPSNAASSVTPDLSKLTAKQVFLVGNGTMNTSGGQIDYAAVTADKGLVVCGYFEGKRVYGSTTITSHKVVSPNHQNPWYDWDAFVAKADANGKWLWASALASTKGAACDGLAVNSDGTIQALISFYGTRTFSGQSVAGPSSGQLVLSATGKTNSLTQTHPVDLSANPDLNLYARTGYKEIPAFIGGRVSAQSTYWKINGLDTEFLATSRAGGVIAKQNATSFSWVKTTPGNTALGHLGVIASSDGGVIADLNRWDSSSVTYAGFTTTTGDNSLIKYSSTGQIVWGFEVPNRRITAYQELPNDSFLVAQGIESAWDVSDFKLQVYSNTGSLQQSFNLAGTPFPPRQILVVSPTMIWVRTGATIILLKPAAPAKSLSCTTLNAKYPGGIAYSPFVKNKGKALRYRARVSPAIYSTYKALDTDKDLLVCER